MQLRSFGVCGRRGGKLLVERVIFTPTRKSSETGHFVARGDGLRAGGNPLPQPQKKKKGKKKKKKKKKTHTHTRVYIYMYTHFLCCMSTRAYMNTSTCAPLMFYLYS